MADSIRPGMARTKFAIFALGMLLVAASLPLAQADRSRTDAVSHGASIVGRTASVEAVPFLDDWANRESIFGPVLIQPIVDDGATLLIPAGAILQNRSGFKMAF